MLDMRNILFFFLSIQSLWATGTFDLRDHGFTSNPKVQVNERALIFSLVAAMESNILVENSWGADTVVDLSEKDLISKANLHGDYKLAAAYISNTGGAVAESKSDSNASKYKYLPSSIEWLTYGSYQVNIERIQESITENGSVASIGHKSNSSWEVSLNGDVLDFNFSLRSSTHPVNIIGWDDNRVIPPFLPGVWIVQDSNLRSKVSYYLTPYANSTIGQEAELGGVSFKGIKSTRFKNIYSYALHGWQYEFSAEKISNLYNLKEELPIKVGIYTVIPDDSAVVIISDIEGNILCHSKNRTISNPGFYLLELICGNKKKINGQVRVELITESGLYAHDADKFYLVDSKPVLIKTNSSFKESFFFKNGKWIDFKSHYFKSIEQIGKKLNISSSGNFALNLYTK
jgi:hypothetical protein